MLELYTSEGCSSCPPADRWFSKLRNDPNLWTEFVPLALHVDYWDYIGWKDRFARPEYADRQRRYAAEGGARVIYTPGMFSGGEDWQGWRRRQDIPDSEVQPGNLVLSLEDQEVTVAFRNGQRQQGLVAHVALLANGLQTDVKAGENRGRKLRHDFVVTQIERVELSNGETTLHGQLDWLAFADSLETYAEADQFALVAWVAADDRQTPLQSVGGYLPDL